MENIKKILQVEDEECIQGMVARVLSINNIEVELASDFTQAAEALEGTNGYSGLSQYDAFLLDMSFPGGNGADIARMIRERGHEGRIVMFSGRDIEEARKQTRDLCNIGYLNKPQNNIKNFLPALKGTYSE